MRLPVQLVLASTSPYRRALLERLSPNFVCDPPRVDETQLSPEAPAALVRRLAYAKAKAVAVRHPQSLVIGSDQVAALDDTVVGKPGSHARAITQLSTVSGRLVSFYTAVCVLDTRNQQHHEHLDTTHVRFRQLSTVEIERYLQVEQPYDCAGSFKSEGLGISLFDAIESEDPTALIGLPLIGLCRLLRACGLTLP
ncbi:MAG: Maf family nucleotide pyrophosphatase [Gammaproteobacteria bacterium]